ncbi:hypothetical protein ED328_09345 [Muribaculaceae bacterium Isolate-001 (NCI)]|nr:hypothetical protein ED328_09345 [Muribaculaceae bacterium Isolate-001 (NCI)]
MLEYVKNNPYRILGVYANDPEKKWVENSLELFVSLKHDNTFAFPTDWPEALGPMYRTMKNVKDAAFILEDNDLRTLEALFWVHSKGASSFISNLGINIDLEMGICPYEKAVNSALRSLAKGDFHKALYQYKSVLSYKRPSSKVLVLFFGRVIKSYLRDNPNGNVFSFLYGIFGDEFRLEFQEALKSCSPVEEYKTTVKNDHESSTTAPRNDQQTNPQSKSQTKPKKKISFDWKKFNDNVIRPWRQFNGWTYFTIVLIITAVYILCQMFK